MTIRNLDALLAPASIALIGATDRAGSVGAMIARNLAASAVDRRVHFVSPRLDRILDRPCHRSIAALPEAPDLAVIATPPGTVADIAGELAARGTRAIVAITAGLDAGQKLALLEAGRDRLVRVLGPNSIGLMLPHLGVNASFAHCEALPGDLAFLSQSGALVTAVVDWATTRQIGFSHVVSLGDMADVDFGDLLDYLAGDTKSRAILLYMEAVTQRAEIHVGGAARGTRQAGDRDQGGAACERGACGSLPYRPAGRSRCRLRRRIPPRWAPARHGARGIVRGSRDAGASAAAAG